MPVYVVGRRSYLGGILLKHLAPRHAARAVSLAELPATTISSDDVIINCAFAPDWYHSDLPDDLGFDGSAAAAARRTGARYVMISTRAVYASRLEPPLSESEPVAPTSAYGRNKARIEAGLRELLGERLLILRLANVFGSEPVGRRTFVSTALASLVRQGSIELDIAPDTRKDFVPASFVGRAAACLIDLDGHGVVNVGSGVALSAGRVAQALLDGYGKGTIHHTGTAFGEEFRLDVTELRRRTGLSLTPDAVLLELEHVAKDCSEHVRSS